MSSSHLILTTACLTRISHSEAVTDGHINAAARSLAQTRTDLAARMAEVDALSSAAHDDDSGKGFFSMFTSSPNAASEYDWLFCRERILID
jgi:hypothetical protein